MAWVGTTLTTGEGIPGAGTWEIVDHPGCRGQGTLRSLAPGSPAPLCPVCDRPVVWQLTHLASTVAADHHGVGHLP
jgi:hypothetical protein